MYKPGGTHIFIDVELNDNSMPTMNEMLEILNIASVEAGSTVLEITEAAFNEEKTAYTICLLLSESHTSVHTWPEHNFLSIDFFFCGGARWEKAVEYVQDALSYRKFKIEKHRRGV